MLRLNYKNLNKLTKTELVYGAIGTLILSPIVIMFAIFFIALYIVIGLFANACSLWEKILNNE